MFTWWHVICFNGVTLHQTTLNHNTSPCPSSWLVLQGCGQAVPSGGVGLGAPPREGQKASTQQNIITKHRARVPLLVLQGCGQAAIDVLRSGLSMQPDPKISNANHKSTKPQVQNLTQTACLYMHLILQGCGRPAMYVLRSGLSMQPDQKTQLPNPTPKPIVDPQ